jgi:uncharacterized integral membrane protein (TIGR00698 family)
MTAELPPTELVDIVAKPAACNPSQSSIEDDVATRRWYSATEPPAVLRFLPGLALTLGIAGTATLLHGLPGLSFLSPMILAATIGIALRNVLGVDQRLSPGIGFSMRLPLRTAIVLLGLQLTISQLASMGAEAFLVVTLSLVGTFAFMLAAGRSIGVESGLVFLLATGTSICGAAAIVAANAVVRAKDGDVFYALGCITLFGTAAMFAYPPLGAVIGLGPAAFGVWSGASIHEVAQVVGAAFQYGQASGEVGTIAKLTRVLMLAPVVLLLPFLVARASAGAASEVKVPIPWFVFAFIAMIGVNSLLFLPSAMTTILAQVTVFLLAVALAAMGLETDFRVLSSQGIRPLLLAGLGTIFISVLSLMLIKLLMTS